MSKKSPSNKARLGDIKPYIIAASDPVDVPWGYLEDWLSNMEKTARLDLSPDYQRGHVWTETQQERYVEHILRRGKTGRELSWNNPTWSGRSDATPSHPDYARVNVTELVDGKQRLEAVRKFMRGELRAFGRTVDEYEDAANLRALTGPRFLMFINELQTRREVLQWYLDMNSGGTVHSDEEIARVRAMVERDESNQCPQLSSKGRSK
jgi:Protein of unknown function DUF262